MITQKEKDGYLKAITESVNSKERRTAYLALSNKLFEDLALEQLNERIEKD